MITADSNALLALHRHWQSGRMPYSGGVREQPAKFIAAMDVLDDGFHGAT